MEEIRCISHCHQILSFVHIFMDQSSQGFGFWPSLKVMPHDMTFLLHSNQDGPSKTLRRQLPPRRPFQIAEFQALTPLNTVPKTAWLPHSLRCAGTAVKELTLAAIDHGRFVSASLRIAFHQETLNISQKNSERRGANINRYFKKRYYF